MELIISQISIAIIILSLSILIVVDMMKYREVRDIGIEHSPQVTKYYPLKLNYGDIEKYLYSKDADYHYEYNIDDGLIIVGE